VNTKPFVDVVIGVLRRDDQVCLSVRQSHQSFAEHWEFPGGKVEAHETSIEALKREFKEELAVDTAGWKPLIEIPWHYDNVSVRLHVFITDEFIGEPKGNEGQKVEWHSVRNLRTLNFPTANSGLITALELADQYMITGKFSDFEDAKMKLVNALESGVKLCQLRAKDISPQAFIELAQQCIPICHDFGSKILLNGQVDLLGQLPDADGIQLASNMIYDYTERPISKQKLLGISTHTAEDIDQALKLQADFILVSPVRETSSHPGLPGMGWQTFKDTVKEIPIPVFALGGMSLTDVDEAKKRGGQGIAAISCFWPN